MADESVILNPGSGGAAIAVDTIGGVSHELVKVEFGSDGIATQVDAANPLPVTDVVAEASLADIAANQQTDALTDAELRASPIDVTGTVTLSGGAIDNTILYSNTLSIAGAISGMDTTGYQSVIIQVSGDWVGNLAIEGCNDNSLFLPLLVLNTNEISMNDTVFGNGNYTFKVTTKWFRINVEQLQMGSVSLLALGRTTIGISSSDLLSMAMDKSNGTPLYVEETAIKKDANNAIMLSDGVFVTGRVENAVSSTSKVIDTAGYKSVTFQILFQTGVPNMAFQGSNDLVTWTSVPFRPEGTGVEAIAFNGVGIYSVPCRSRYMRLFNASGTSTPTTFIATLRQLPLVTGPANINMTQVAGTSTLSGGTAGSLAVGGTVANGATATGQNPVLVAGADPSGLLRRLATDISGRLINSITDGTGTGRAVGGFSGSSNQYNVASQAVQDVGQFEGQSIYELLGLILLEMRINNQYLYELPLTLQRVLNDTSKINVGGFGNEPQEFRNDSTMFAA